MRQGGRYLASAVGKKPQLVSQTKRPEHGVTPPAKQEVEAETSSKKATSRTEK